MGQIDRRRVSGWIAVGLSTTIACLWAFWGIVENFHEGWYYESFLANLGLMFGQYLSPMLAFLGVTLVAIYWPRLGAGLHFALALLIAWFFQAWTNTVVFLLLLPLIGLGFLYWFGRPQPRKIAALLAAGLPLLTLVIAGTGPALRVSQRLDDGNLEARLVRGNGVALVWAPAGPGWPDAGADWHEATRACQYLDPDGLALAPDPQDIWRLPTVDEAVRSLARHGQNSGGVWDAGSARATYETTPDKESPLWDAHSQVIYWWTSLEQDPTHAYIIVYNGQVQSRSKDWGPDYLGFRCVKPPEAAIRDRAEP